MHDDAILVNTGLFKITGFTEIQSCAV